MSLLASPTPFGAAAIGRRAAPLPLLPAGGGRAALHVALARRGGVSSRTQRRLEERGGKKRRGGVAAPDVDEDAVEAGAAEWEGEPLGFEVSTEPMPQLPDPETPDFWEGPQWEALGFFVQYMWAFGVVFGLIACGVAVATYNDGATDFRDTPAYKESQSQEFPEEAESSGADVFEGNPTELIACGVAVATYNDGATDFRDTPAYKESQTQEFPEEAESSSADVFEGNPTEVAPALE